MWDMSILWLFGHLIKTLKFKYAHLVSWQYSSLELKILLGANSEAQAAWNYTNYSTFHLVNFLLFFVLVWVVVYCLINNLSLFFITFHVI